MEPKKKIELKIQKFEQDEDMYPERDLYTICEAKYAKHGMVIDDPDLCALQKPFSPRKIIQLSTIKIRGYDYEDVKHMTLAERKENVLSLQKAFSPLVHIIDMADAVYQALVSSYNAREIKINASQTAIYSRTSGLGGRALSFVVSGVTGAGKTVAIELIRKMYPPVHHTIFNIEYTQIPVIKVTALVGNMSELMIAIAKAIDDIFGNGPVWELKAKKNNLGLAAAAIKDAIRTYHIGLIIIDESQFMKFDSSHTSLENLVGIAEDTGCALGLIGNKELIPKLDRYPRLVSRTMFNRIEVSPTDETNRKYFIQAVRHLWTYQWTKQYTEITDAIIDELVRGSMYNIQILKNLLMRIQDNAISKYPKEGITPEYIRGISEQYFATIRSLILDGSEESERIVLKMLSQQTDKIKSDAKRLAAKANIKYLEERDANEEKWGQGRYEELEKLVRTFGVSSGNLKKIINKMMASDPHLPERDIASIADDVKQYIEENKKDYIQVSRSKKVEVDKDMEHLVQEVMKDSLKGLV